MGQLNQRQGFLVSSVVHMVILTLLWSGPEAPRLTPPIPEEAAPRVSQKVFLPPPAVLKQLQQARPAMPSPPPTPPPAAATPPPPKAKDRISVGAPSEVRSKDPLLLRREDDLTAVAKGRPDAVPSLAPTPAPGAATASGGVAGAEGSEGLQLPPGADGLTPPGDGGARPRPGPSAPSIASSLRNLESRLQTQGTQGLPTGTGKQMGPLFFDPEGADFTLWVNHFKNEVYRNWIVPQPALLGFRGHVDLEFSVERDGRLTNLRLLKSSGTPAMDRAAQNALLGSRLLPLPADFGPQRVQMQVTFFYNEGPQSS